MFASLPDSRGLVGLVLVLQWRKERRKLYLYTKEYKEKNYNAYDSCCA
jgi:hypothetical protein